jgi:hypothetical protein
MEAAEAASVGRHGARDAALILVAYRHTACACPNLSACAGIMSTCGKSCCTLRRKHEIRKHIISVTSLVLILAEQTCYGRVLAHSPCPISGRADGSAGGPRDPSSRSECDIERARPLSNVHGALRGLHNMDTRRPRRSALPDSHSTFVGHGGALKSVSGLPQRGQPGCGGLTIATACGSPTSSATLGKRPQLQRPRGLFLLDQTGIHSPC